MIQQLTGYLTFCNFFLKIVSMRVKSIELDKPWAVYIQIQTTATVITDHVESKDWYSTRWRIH